MTELCASTCDDIVDVDAVGSVLVRSFIAADEALAAQPRMMVKSKLKPPRRGEVAADSKVEHEFVTIDNSGSTACLCLVGTKDIITANLGDSRAVLAQTQLQGPGISCVNLSFDHKPNLPNEDQRIAKSGCRYSNVDQ